MAKIIALIIKIILLLAALKKLWQYILKSNLVNILLFIVAAHKAGKKKEDGSSKRSRDIDGKTDSNLGGGLHGG